MTRTYFVYINERCHLLCHDPQKSTWIEYWIKSRIPYTSPHTPPPFGLYPVAMMTHFGDCRYANLCVWQVSADGDVNDAAEPLELKYRSETEQQCAFDAVYEWIEAHPFECFKHDGLRGTENHNVKMYDLPTPGEDSSRTWRAHWKRWRWIEAEWEAFALTLAANTNQSVQQGQPHCIDLTRPAETAATVIKDEDDEVSSPVVERENPTTPPPSAEKTYGLPSAPAPPVFLPPHIIQPSGAGPNTLTPRPPTPMFPCSYGSSPGTSPMTPNFLRRCSTPGLGYGTSTPSSSSSTNLFQSPSLGFRSLMVSPTPAGAKPMTPSPLHSCSPAGLNPRIFSSSPSDASTQANSMSSLSFPTPPTASSLPWGFSGLLPTPSPASQEPNTTPSVYKPPSPPLPPIATPLTTPPLINPLVYMISGTPFQARKPDVSAPSLKRKSIDESNNEEGRTCDDDDDDGPQGYANRPDDDVEEGEDEDEQTDDQEEEQGQDVSGGDTASSSGQARGGRGRAGRGGGRGTGGARRGLVWRKGF